MIQVFMYIRHFPSESKSSSIHFWNEKFLLSITHNANYIHSCNLFQITVGLAGKLIDLCFSYLRCFTFFCKREEWNTHLDDIH